MQSYATCRDLDRHIGFWTKGDSGTLLQCGNVENRQFRSRNARSGRLNGNVTHPISAIEQETEKLSKERAHQSSNELEL
jgi:hypothetical protein